MTFATLHPSAQLAACRTGAGIAVRDDFRVLELSGRPSALNAAIHAAAGQRLRTSATAATAGVWWRRTSPQRALVLFAGEPPSALRHPDIAVRDAGHAVIAAAGPRARALAHGELVASESESHALIVVTDAEAAVAELLEAGAVAVEPATLDLYWAAQRIVDCQRRWLSVSRR